ncbi:MAG: chromosome segregation protein SMC [Candidatus Dormibacteria bacterium]
MHLKSLQVQGFKTFARPTELVFEPGITAIVGPNGSGKSNLVDAIRWVLGERSARELRGTRMEEIIYSGGARRPASGMAEVKLVIDNTDGRLPLPYAEVEVVRRGYRNGESDFWLNGSRCRMRDIDELFASTGLTQQGYAVVAQDDVDFIIQTSAAERRAMIEEAAGVRGLRSRRQEAITRLKEADLSLVRLHDLVRELGPRVSELRQQAAQATQFNELSGRLDALRGSVLRGEWLASRQRLGRGSARVSALEATVVAASAESERFTLSYEEQRRLLAEAHDARLARERQVGELRLRLSRATSRIELFDERKAAAGQQVAELEGHLAAALDRAAVLESELEAALAERDRAVSIQDNPQDEAAIAAHAAASARHLDLARALSAAQRALQEMGAQQRRLADILVSVQHRRDSAGAVLEDLRLQVSEAEAELAGAAFTEHSELRARRDAAVVAAVELRRAIDQLAMAREVDEGSRRARGEAAERLHRLEERVTSLALLTPASERPAAGAKRLAELLEVEEGYAVAVESALGREILDSWVMADATSEGQLLHELTAGSADASMLAVHGVRAAPVALPPPRAEAILGHVGGPSWLMPALTILLRDTWLVPDIEAGRVLCDERPGRVAVTLTGQAVAGLQLRSRPRSRVVEAQQLLRRAEGKLVETREQLRRADEQQLSARVAVEQAEEEVTRAQAADVAATAAHAQMDARRLAAEERMAAAQARLDRLRLQVEDRRTALASTDGEAEAAQQRALEADTARAATEQAAVEAAVLEAAAGEEADRLRWAAESGRAQRGAIQAQRQAAQNLLAQADQSLMRHRADVAALRARAAELEASSAELRRLRSDALAELDVLKAELEAVPADGSQGQVEVLTATLLEMERENMRRRVELAHQEESLAAADAARAAEEAILSDLAARLGDLGPAPEDEGDVDWERSQREIVRLERQIAGLGPVNPLAIEEYARDSERLGGIDGQMEDLRKARADLDGISSELTGEIDKRFEAVFGAVAFNFQETFSVLFPGGRATLRLDDPTAAEPGVEILAQPAGKRMRGIKLLSGGERALTALAFILALEKVNPSPFYIFDEVDAPLDDANVRRFATMLQSMVDGNQFLLVTHNHATMTAARALYGVTLEDSGVSRVVSVRLRGEDVVAPVDGLTVHRGAAAVG